MTKKTPIKKVSKIKKAIKYSFTYIWIEFQLVRIHKGINKAVKITKNNEIPSTPKTIFKFEEGIQEISVINWNFEVCLLNNTHKNKDIKNVVKENAKAFIFNDNVFLEGIVNNRIAPINGSKHKTKRIPLPLIKFISENKSKFSTTLHNIVV